MHRNFWGRLLGLGVVILGGAAILQSQPTLAKKLSSQLNPVTIQRSFENIRVQADGLFSAKQSGQSSSKQPGSSTSSTAATATSDKATQQTENTNANATPVESIVSGVKLDSTYYYDYAPDDSPAVRQAFADAIQVYNATGIVTLKPGQAGSGQNQLTLGNYHEVSKAADSGAVEVGHGGPEIHETFLGSVRTGATNHGSAKLNTAYLSSYNDAVAIHEVGHVLGLDHSTDPNSVMYPVTQGKVQLTSGDIAALHSIYDPS